MRKKKLENKARKEMPANKANLPVIEVGGKNPGRVVIFKKAHGTSYGNFMKGQRVRLPKGFDEAMVELGFAKFEKE